MRAVLKSNNPVLLSYAANLLEQEGIGTVVFDENASVMDGSAGVLPRRLMVLDEDFASADQLLRQAIPDEMPAQHPASEGAFETPVRTVPDPK